MIHLEVVVQQPHNNYFHDWGLSFFAKSGSKGMKLFGLVPHYPFSPRPQAQTLPFQSRQRMCQNPKATPNMAGILFTRWNFKKSPEERPSWPMMLFMESEIGELDDWHRSVNETEEISETQRIARPHSEQLIGAIPESMSVKK